MAAVRISDLPEPRRGPTRTPLNADTSTEPEGITRRVMLNILEAFFRNPLLHLLPLVLLVGLGLASLVGGSTSYRSVGTITVTDESLLSDLTNAGANQSTSFDPPATRTARQMSDLLGTTSFGKSVIEAGGLQSAVEAGVFGEDEVGSVVGVSAGGDNIVAVTASTTDGEVSRRLVAGTIEAYSDFLVANYRTQSESTVRSLTERLTQKQGALRTIDEEIDALIAEDPQTAIEDRSFEATVRYERLNSSREQAQAQVTAAEDALDQANLTNDQADTIVNQRMAELDVPAASATPEGRLRKGVLTVMVFAALGALLSLASVVIAATLDHSIRVPNDITARFGVDVLAVIPNRGR